MKISQRLLRLLIFLTLPNLKLKLDIALPITAKKLTSTLFPLFKEKFLAISIQVSLLLSLTLVVLSIINSSLLPVCLKER